MKKSDIYGGFVKGDDVKSNPIIVTIAGAREHKFDDGNTQVVLDFSDDNRSFGLNATNFDACVDVTGQDDTDDWKGHRIEIYFDPNVMYMGRKTGGCRVRKPTRAAASTTPPPPDDGPPDDDNGANEDALKAQAAKVTDKTGAWAVWSAKLKGDPDIQKKWCEVRDSLDKPPSQFGPGDWKALAEAAFFPF